MNIVKLLVEETPTFNKIDRHRHWIELDLDDDRAVRSYRNKQGQNLCKIIDMVWPDESNIVPVPLDGAKEK